MKSFGYGLLVVFFVAFMGSCAGTACAPGTAHLVAPVLCDGPELAIVTSSRSTANGNGSSTTFDGYCVHSDGTADVVSNITIASSLFVLYLAAGLFVFGVAGVTRLAMARRNARLLGLSALTLLAGCSAGTYTSDEFDRKYPEARSSAFRPGTLLDMRATLETNAGSPLRVRKVYLSDGLAHAEAQDAGNPKHLDEYRFRDGAFDGKPRPVSLSSSEEAALAQSVFTWNEVAWDQILPLAKRTRQDLGLDGARVDSVSVWRSKNDGVTLSFFVRSPRKDLSVVYDAHGNKLRVEE